MIGRLTTVAALVALAALAHAPTTTAAVNGIDTFDRIVVIVEQDHTFDSYFGDRVTTPAGLQSIADRYVLFDRYFSSSAGGTLGNMLDLTTGDTHDLQNSSKKSLTALADIDVPTVFDRMNDAGVDWRLFVGDLARVDPARVADGSYLPEGEPVPAALYRAPVLAMRRTWTDQHLTQRFADQDAFFDAARAGTLPEVSFVFPSPTDHPGQPGDAGITRLLSLINAVQKGPQWESTAVFVTWDDGGGQFDREVPPVGNGLRVPLLLISAYAKQGHVDSTQHDHLSLLRLIETRFGLEPLRQSADGADAFDDAFDVGAGPREPLVLAPSELAPTPVGTAQQNFRTSLLYLVGAGVAACVAMTGWFLQRQRATR